MSAGGGIEGNIRKIRGVPAISRIKYMVLARRAGEVYPS